MGYGARDFTTRAIVQETLRKLGISHRLRDHAVWQKLVEGKREIGFRDLVAILNEDINIISENSKNGPSLKDYGQNELSNLVKEAWPLWEALLAVMKNFEKTKEFPHDFFESKEVQEKTIRELLPDLVHNFPYAKPACRTPKEAGLYILPTPPWEKKNIMKVGVHRNGPPLENEDWVLRADCFEKFTEKKANFYSQLSDEKNEVLSGENCPMDIIPSADKFRYPEAQHDLQLLGVFHILSVLQNHFPGIDTSSIEPGVLDLDNLTSSPNAPSLREQLRKSIDGEPTRCLYSQTYLPDEHFIVGWHPSIEVFLYNIK